MTKNVSFTTRKVGNYVVDFNKRPDGRFGITVFLNCKQLWESEPYGRFDDDSVIEKVLIDCLQFIVDRNDESRQEALDKMEEVRASA